MLQRHLAITQTMVEPDPLKIKYREALINAVQSVVKGICDRRRTLLHEWRVKLSMRPTAMHSFKC